MAEGILVVAPEVYSILPLFNGKNSLLDIQVELTRKRGELVFRDTTPVHDIDRAKGLRLLSRNIALALQFHLENTRRTRIVIKEYMR